MQSHVTVLGWDPAYKSLAWAHMRVNVNVFDDLRAVAAECVSEVAAGGDREQCEAAVARAFARYCDTINGALQMRSCGVADVLHGAPLASVKESSRAAALKCFLRAMPASADRLDAGTVVAIERQPRMLWKGAGDANTTGASNTVGAQLDFNYCDCAYVTYIGPGRKNKLEIGGYALATFGAGYAARKKHTAAMARYMSALWGFDTSAVPAACYDDYADALFTALLGAEWKRPSRARRQCRRGGRAGAG